MCNIYITKPKARYLRPLFSACRKVCCKGKQFNGNFLTLLSIIVHSPPFLAHIFVTMGAKGLSNNLVEASRCLPQRVTFDDYC